MMSRSVNFIGSSSTSACFAPNAAVSGRFEFVIADVVGVEEREDEVAVGIVAVTGDDRPPQRPLALGRLPPLRLEGGQLVDLRCPAFHELHELHRFP